MSSMIGSAGVSNYVNTTTGVATHVVGGPGVSGAGESVRYITDAAGAVRVLEDGATIRVLVDDTTQRVLN